LIENKTMVLTSGAKIVFECHDDPKWPYITWREVFDFQVTVNVKERVQDEQGNVREVIVPRTVTREKEIASGTRGGPNAGNDIARGQGLAIYSACCRCRPSAPYQPGNPRTGEGT